MGSKFQRYTYRIGSRIKGIFGENPDEGATLQKRNWSLRADGTRYTKPPRHKRNTTPKAEVNRRAKQSRRDRKR